MAIGISSSKSIDDSRSGRRYIYDEQKSPLVLSVILLTAEIALPLFMIILPGIFAMNGIEQKNLESSIIHNWLPISYKVQLILGCMMIIDLCSGKQIWMYLLYEYQYGCSLLISLHFVSFAWLSIIIGLTEAAEFKISEYEKVQILYAIGDSLYRLTWIMIIGEYKRKKENFVEFI